MSDAHQHDEARGRPGLLKGLLFLGVVGGVIAGGVYLALGQRADGGAIVATEAPAPIPVNVFAISKTETLTLSESFGGIAEARRSSDLGFERGGRIERIFVDVGDRVKAGTVLARLDTRALQAQLSSINAQTKEARASRDLAQATVERFRQLAAKDLTPQQRLDEAEAALTQAEARIEASLASAELVEVQISLSRITAPYDGVVTARMADEGAIAGPGVPLLRVVEDGAVEFRFGLPVAVAARLDPEASYTLKAESGEVQVRLKAETGVVSATSRTVEVVFAAGPEANVRSGEVVRLSFDRTIEERGFWLPVTALTEASRGLWSVYSIEQDGEGGYVISPRLVEMVHTEGPRAFVRGPLRDGEPVVIDGIQRLVPGMRVTPVEVDAERTIALQNR